MRRDPLIGMLAVLMFFGCSDTKAPGSGTPGVATSVEVTPPQAGVAPGSSVQLAATLRDAFGDSVAGGATVTWESLNPTIVTVSDSGVVHSEGPLGRAVVRARSGSLSSDATIEVLDFTSSRVYREGAPYAAALSSTGVAFITLLSGGQLARTDLPSQAFTPAVAVGHVPTEVAFNSSGTRAYVTNQYSQNVSVVDVASNTVIDTIAVPGDPFEIIVEPGDSIIYVSTRGPATGDTGAILKRVFAIRLSTKAVILSFTTSPGIVNGMVVRDTLLYMSTHEAGTVIEFNLRTRAVARTFTVGGIPQKMTLSADGNTLFIANEAGYVQFWDLVSGTQDGANIALPGSAGYGIARRASDGLLYVTTAYGRVFGSGRGSVHVIDPVSRRLVYTTATGGSTREIIFDSSGNIGFVPNEGGWVDFLR